MRAIGIGLMSAVLVGCSSQQPKAGGTATATSSLPASTSSTVGAAPPRPSSEPEVPVAPTPSFDDVASVLFADRSNVPARTAACPASVPPDARVRCLFDERYRGDAKAASLAYELFAKWEIVAGVEVGHTMDGGYRGMIRIEPALPIAGERKHLEWIVGAMHDFDRFFAELDKRAEASSAPLASRRYRFRPIVLRFMRSVAARTPSAYAQDWTVAWNLAGSLHTSADAVRETLFHEIFHLNDYAHPGAVATTDPWSIAALSGPFDSVVKKCGTAIACLGPYSPNDTIVRNGTYYSFQPGNGVREYAAELALRYYREQRAVFQRLPSGGKKSFKCGPPENGRAWSAMRDEFFAGVDVVPACGS